MGHSTHELGVAADLEQLRQRGGKTSMDIGERPRLLSGEEAGPANEELRKMYAGIAQALASMTDDELATRVRGYDNNQRLTFGRGQSRPLKGSYVRRDFAATDVEQLDFDGPDQSFFPASLDEAPYSALGDIVRSCASHLLLDERYDNDDLLVTVFLHRVVVGAEERYVGFFHRDLPQKDGRIGTVVMYPDVRYENMHGAELIAYHDGAPLSVLRDQQPEYVFQPEEYRNAALVMPYPCNFAHGVRPGVNPCDRTSDEPALRNFIKPPDDAFVKEVAIFCLSNISPVEH